MLREAPAVDPQALCPPVGRGLRHGHDIVGSPRWLDVRLQEGQRVSHDRCVDVAVLTVQYAGFQNGKRL
jgi:hypothetical protein